MENYLLKPLETYFSKILVLESKLSISEIHLRNYSKQLLNENREFKSLHSRLTTYRDVSLIQGGHNLFLPNYSFEMDMDTLNKQIDDILSHQASFAVAQAFEFFETFLIDIITDYLFCNQKKLEIIGLSDKVILHRAPIRKKVKYIKKGNKDRFSILRKSCSFFQKHEISNIYNYNITQWFHLITLVRHDIIHNGQKPSRNLLEYIRNNNLKKVFDEQIDLKNIDNETSFFFKFESAQAIIEKLNSLSHLVFKSISIELNLPTMVPQYIPPSRFY